MDSKQRALLATEYKIERIKNQSGFLVKNLWKVIGFGVFISFWAPTYRSGPFAFKNESALQASDYSYLFLVGLTALGYTVVCFLGSFIWKWQDDQQLKILIKKKEQLEKELSSEN
ncbi:MAG: hypothetical protein ABI371_05300 [Gelidibacter sp.]